VPVPVPVPLPPGLELEPPPHAMAIIIRESAANIAALRSRTIEQPAWRTDEARETMRDVLLILFVRFCRAMAKTSTGIGFSRSR
jgi:hypothetical protein